MLELRPEFHIIIKGSLGPFPGLVVRRKPLFGLDTGERGRVPAKEGGGGVQKSVAPTRRIRDKAGGRNEVPRFWLETM